MRPRQLIQEHLRCAWKGISTRHMATVMPPRQQFFEGLLDDVRGPIRTMLEIGVGSGRLAETAAKREGFLPKDDGLYIGVECDPEWINFIRRERRDVYRDPRIKFIPKFAQEARRDIELLLEREDREPRKIDLTVVSIPHSLLPEKDILMIWKMITELSAPQAQAILYNVCSTRSLLECYWDTVKTRKNRSAHFYMPPYFEVNRASTPLARPQIAAHGNGNGNGNGAAKVLPDLSHFVRPNMPGGW